MNFKVLTLFPEMIESVMHTGIMGRALKEERFTLSCRNIRDFADNDRAQIDDYTYGGGAGMLLRAQPVYDAYLAIAGDSLSEGKRPRCIYMTPTGAPFTERMAKELSKEEELIFLCGHYEGVDERVLDEIVTDRISAGDYVLSGGELPALMVMDAVARLLPGVLGNETSADVESFYRDLLEYPQYSRPEVWHEKAVPEILLTGKHEQIENWRLEESKKITERVRPELYRSYLERERLSELLKRDKRSNIALLEALRFDDIDLLYEDAYYILIKDHDTEALLLGKIDRSEDPLSEEGMQAVLAAYEEEFPLFAPRGSIREDTPGFSGQYPVKLDSFLSLYTERHPVPTKSVRASEDPEKAKRIAVWANGIIANGRIPYLFTCGEDRSEADFYESLGFYTAKCEISEYFA